MFGYSVQEAVGQSLELLIPAHLRDAHRAGMDRMARDAPSTIIGNSVEIPAIRRDGSEFAAEITLTQWERAGATLYGASIKDVTARKEAEAELFKLAHYDALTQAGNRTLFERDIKNAGENRDVQSMLMVDLDGFKTINDCFGHGVGDEILREAAQRIRFGIGDEGMLYRLGGDEFGIVVKEGEISAANDIADRVIELFNIPFKAHGKPMRLGASIGIARFEHTEIATALGNADLAMYEAKRAGGGIKVIYNDDMRRDLEARHSLQSELQAAFEAGEFRLYYQPQIDLRTGALKGAEALLRWEHPQRGLLNPGVFIDELEKSPVAAKVGSWIIREACRETARIRRHGANDFCIGVNLFAAQLKRGDLCAVVHSALVQNGLPATALELEITETTILDNEDFYVPQLRALRARGVRIAFDDYGTGWASLSLLKRYPLTRLKIDRSFVRDIPDDLDDAAIVKAVIAMADSLGLDVIAEGIETDRQEEFLRRNACETGQGFLYGQPMPVNEFLNLIAAKSFFTAGVEVQRYG